MFWCNKTGIDPVFFFHFLKNKVFYKKYFYRIKTLTISINHYKLFNIKKNPGIHAVWIFCYRKIYIGITKQNFGKICLAVLKFYEGVAKQIPIFVWIDPCKIIHNLLSSCHFRYIFSWFSCCTIMKFKNSDGIMHNLCGRKININKA